MHFTEVATDWVCAGLSSAAGTLPLVGRPTDSNAASKSVQLPDEALNLGRRAVRELEGREVAHPIEPPHREPWVRGRERLLRDEELGDTRLREQV